MNSTSSKYARLLGLYPAKAINAFVIWLCSLLLVASLAPVFAAASITTTTTLASAVNPVQVGTPTELTATVTGTNPTGNVTFKNGTAILGTAVLDGTGDTRTAVFSAIITTAGAKSLKAVYAGDAINKTSTSLVLAQTVNKLAATATLESATNPVTVGAPTTLTATVTGTNPTGNVSFKNGTATLGTVALVGTGDARTATYSATITTAGDKNLTAVYAGDANNLAATSAALTQSVDKANPTTTVSTSQPSVTQGQSVTFTATVSGYVPSGNVVFKDGATTLATKALSGTGNTRTATYANTTLAVGEHTITVDYVGNANNTISSAQPITQAIVGKASSTTGLASSVNPSTSGQSITLIATVTTSGSAPTGNVTFKNGTATLGTATLTEGVASFSTSALATGTRSLTAVYAGDTFNATSTSAVLSQVVGKASSTTTLSSSANPATVGSSITLSATVTGSTTPAGTVTFKDGATTLGSGTIAAGVATFTTSTLTAGSHSLSALYAGNANNTASTSVAIVQVVNASVASTTTSLTSSASAAAVGSPITFTASIAGNAPTGIVTFKDGATTLGTGIVTGGVANFATSTLAPGSHSITAIYGGDSTNPTSTSAVLIQTVTPALVGNPMTWQYGYDAMDRPTITTDPYGKSVYTYYDTLGRPIQAQQAVGNTQAIISLEYNAADSLTKVTDPRNLQTTYSPTGLGTVIGQTSPDAGTATATFDANLNLTSKTDARGKITTFTYDTLNRLTTVHYASGIDTILEYDGGATPTPAAAGELTKLTDESGSTSYTYDSAGRLSTKTQITSGKSFVVSYTWGDTGSALDKLTAITYPSGNRVNYAYDAQGTISGITVNTVNVNGVGFSGTASPLLSGITLSPSGEVSGWSWASGKTQSKTYDQYGQLSSYKLGDASATGASAGTLRSIGYDGAGRIMAFTHTNNGTSQPNLNQSFAYDDLNQLVSASIGNSTIQYSYDLNGNRTSKVISGTAFNNAVSPTSNKLTQTQDVGGTATIQYDNAGNITNDGVNTYTYSDRGRLSSVTTVGGTVNYRYNGFELRTYKSGPTAIITTGAAYYVYDESGKLLGEYDANQNPIYETIYLGFSPVGVLKQTGTAQSANIATGIFNVYSDHLDAPRVITQQSDEAIVWRWDGAEAFGATAPDQNPNSLGAFVFNQRLPGQVFDAETGLFQNWNREYDSRLGRYRQSDPIGLAGGINTFAYVGGNPVSFVDPKGLFIDIIADIGFVAYDLYKLATGGVCDRNENLTALGLDVAGVFIPGITGLGAASRAAKEANIIANGVRGRASEARVLQDLGLTKNTSIVSTAEGRAIPDALTTSLSVEIKDAANVSLTRQLRIQTEAARAAGRESVLITGENTCVSGACSRAFDTIIRRSDLGPR